MIKKLICLICSLALICSMFMVNAAEEEKPISVYLDGTKIEFDVPPQVINDRVMVPLRAISEKLGAVVTWYEEEQIAYVSKGSISAEIKVNYDHMKLYNDLIKLDTPPVILDNRVFVPLRAIAEAFYIGVDWNDAENAVYISSVTEDTALINRFSSRFRYNCVKTLKDYKNGKYGDEMFYLAGKNIVIYLKDDTATIVCNQSFGRYKTRQLSKEEFQAFNALLQEFKVDSLSDWDHDDSHSEAYQYLHCTKDYATSFYINNPGVQGGDIYKLLVNKFADLAETGDFEVKYRDEFANGVKVLTKSEDYEVWSVWHEGNDLRLLVKQNGKLAWHKYENNTLGETVEEPADITLKDAWDDFPSPNMAIEQSITYPWQAEWNSYYVCKLQEHDSTPGGLYLTKKGEEPILIKAGIYFRPIVIPNTDWVVCSKRDDDNTANSFSLVKINLKTFEEIELLDTWSMPHAYLNNKLLIECNDGMYLYDITTDQKEKVKGVFSGLRYMEGRFLQKATNSNEYYTIKDNHILGTLNLDTFQFTPIADYDGLYCDPAHMWVDEKNDKVYFVTAFHDLIEIPINLGNSAADKQ